MARSKKEIDKELMYKKIMPTASIADDNEPPVERTASQPIQAPVYTQPEPLAPAAKAAIPRPTLQYAQPPEQTFAPAPPEAEPINIMEILLESRLDSAIEKFHCCTCDKCRKNITTLTLNKLPPCYVATQDASKMQEAESQYAGQVATALVQAILNVKSHPSH
ncbi:MAG: late competence development ComFB family protein [Oscillospiraceae bacterium]